DAVTFVGSAVTTSPYRYQCKILVHAPLRDISELFSPATGVLEDRGGGRCLLTTGSDSLAAIMFHLAELGSDFTVLEPPELAEYLREVGERMLRAAGADDGPG